MDDIRIPMVLNRFFSCRKCRPSLTDVRVTITEAGIDPEKAARVPLFYDMLKMHISGQWSRAQFQDCCRKLAILNPSLRSEHIQA